MKPRLEKFTGKKLQPIQVWVTASTRRAFAKLAKEERRTMQGILKAYIEGKVGESR